MSQNLCQECSLLPLGLVIPDVGGDRTCDFCQTLKTEISYPQEFVEAARKELKEFFSSMSVVRG